MTFDLFAQVCKSMFYAYDARNDDATFPITVSNIDSIFILTPV